MRRFWYFTAALLVGMRMLYFLISALGLPSLAEDPQYLLGQRKWVAGVVGIGLLVVDVIAPVPSSIVMWVNGRLFGAGVGTLLSVVGGGGAAGLGYAIGLWGESAGRRWLGEFALTRAHAFFQRHGVVAVVVSRPVPILAEAVSMLAGISRMPAPQYFGAALLGLVPTALIYALAGTYAANDNLGWLVFLAVLGLAGGTWVLGRRLAGAGPGAPRAHSSPEARTTGNSGPPLDR